MRRGPARWIVTHLLMASTGIVGSAAHAEPYSVAPPYPADLRPVALAVGDFNGDTRKDDLAVADSIRNAVTVYYWNSTCATWQFHGQYNTARGPRSLSSADFNDDGRDDIVAACADVDSLTLLYSTASLGYSRRDLATLRYPFTVRAGDIDSDGAADIAVTHWNSLDTRYLRIYWRALADTASFTTLDLPVCKGSTGLDLALLNGDDRLDLVVGCDSTAAADSIAIRVQRVTGDRTFSAPQLYRTLNGPHSLSVAKISGSDSLDIAVACTIDSAVMVFHGTTPATGSFGTPETLSVGNSVRDLITTNFDNAGYNEIVVTSPQENSFAVVRSAGANGVVLPPLVFGTGAVPLALASVQATAGSLPDIVVTEWGENGFRFWVDPADSTTSTVRRDFFTGPGRCLGIASGLINSDAYPDIVVTNPDDASVHVLFNMADGTARFGAGTRYRSGNGAWDIVLDTFNSSDSYLDMAVAARYASLTMGAADTLMDSVLVFIQANSHNGTFAAGVSYLVGRDPRSVTAADVDNDGDRDLVVANWGDRIDPVSGYAYSRLSVLKNTGSGTFSAQQMYYTPRRPRTVRAFYFDKIGRAHV